MNGDVVELGVTSTSYLEEICLNRLPQEIIDIILADLHINEIISIISDETFLKYNGNILESLTKKISRGNYAYTNRIAQLSFIEMYMLTPSINYLNKNNINFLLKPESIYPVLKFYLAYSISNPTPFTITYYVWNLIDFFEIIDIIETIEKLFKNDSNYNNLKFNIELEIDPGLLQIINLNQFFQILLDKFYNNLSHVMIKNYTGEFKFEIAKFPNLTKIWFENCTLKFKSSFKYNYNLDFVRIYPNFNGYNNNKIITLNKSLPVNVKYLNLGNVIFSSNCLSYPTPSNILDLSLSNLKDQSNAYLDNLLKLNLTSTLLSLSLHDIPISNWDSFNSENPDSITFLNYIAANCVNLVNLSLSNLTTNNDAGKWDFQEFHHLRYLEVSKTLINSIKLPDNLKELNVSNNRITDLHEVILKNLPTNLIYLNISNNPINWNQCQYPIIFPGKLITLKLSNCEIGNHLYKIKFPDSVQLLSLEVNKLTLIDNIIFPRNLINLGIGSNYIEKINFPLIPTSTKVIHTTENRLLGPMNLKENSLGESINLDILYLNFNNFRKIDDLKFPRWLRLLNFDDCDIPKLENITFQKSIVELSFNGCNIKSIKNCNFEEGSDLNYFNLSQNQLTDSSLKSLELPPKLLCLNLSSNKLEFNVSENYKNIFKNLKNLTFLNLSLNKFKKIHLNLNLNLYNLDLSNNSLKMVQLSFNELSISQDSELRIVNLSMNKLSTLTPEMIGHNKMCRHDKLIELDLTENKIQKDKIVQNLSSFPSSLKSLLIGYTGKQDKFGYDIGENILNNKFCLGKKIDIPYL